jgi:GNAT superfamily N-acetyltransferase
VLSVPTISLHNVAVEVLSSVGRFDDFATVVGPKTGIRGCWCMAYRNSSLGGQERIKYMQAECASEPGAGVLAYIDGQPAGWCSIAPRATYRRLTRSRTIPQIDDRDSWSAICFVVRAGYRKRGLMHDLLDGAVSHARSHGSELVEGYPADAAGGRIDAISGYVGTVALFERHGFERILQTESHSGHRPRWLMRRYL